jgi:hypothetical protein
MKKDKSYFVNIDKDESLYYDQINQLKDCQFTNIRNVATNVRSRFSKKQQDEWAKEIDRGKGLIENHYQSCEYLFRYGLMHQEKLLNSFNELKDGYLEKEIEVIDWGCGQGIGSMCFYDYLKLKNLHLNIKKITLIEPSEYILNRAENHLKCIINKSIEIVKLPCYFDEIIKSDLKQLPQRIVIHIFSNIIDIEKVNLDVVSRLIKSLGESDNFIICTSPNWNEKVQIRFNYFLNSFKEKSKLIYRQKNTERVYAGSKSEIKSLSDNTLIFSYNANYNNSGQIKESRKNSPKPLQKFNYGSLISSVFCILLLLIYFHSENNKVELLGGLNSVHKTELDIQINSNIIDEDFIDNYMNESSLIVDSFSVDSIDINQSNNNLEDESIELLNNNKQMIEIINFINMNGETNVKLIRDKILKEYNIKLKKREVSRLIDIVNKFNETSEFISLD